MKSSNEKEINVALVLGAGGSRGPALAGALEVLEEHNIPIDLIVGSSSGAIVGAMYSYYQDAKIVKDKVLPLRFKDVVDVSWLNYLLLPWRRIGIASGNNMRRMLSHQLPQCDLQELNIPLVVVGTDATTFETVEITSGNLIEALLASASAPPYFSPVVINSRSLIDGGISSPVPTEVAKQYNPKVIIAINITQHYSRFDSNNMLALSYRSLDIAHYHIARLQCYFADVIINPRIDIDGTDDSKALVLYEAGQKATSEQIPHIQKLLKQGN